MRLVNAVTASVVGIALATYLATKPFLWPAAVIGVGAVSVAIVMLLRRSGRKYYAAAGSFYTLGLAAAIINLGSFPSSYQESPLAALLVFGLLGAVIVALQTVGRRVVQKYAAKIGGEEYATEIYDAIAAVVGLAGVIWTAITLHEKAVRYGGLGVGFTGTLALNFIGAEMQLPVWFLTSGVDAVILIFVGTVLAGFHTLESLHTTWRATKATTQASARAGRSVGGRASAAIDGIRDRQGEDE